MSGEARISILLPLQDEREAGIKCAHSWIWDQTADDGLYEVIALAPGRDRKLERAVRPLLRPQDRWLEIRGASSSELFNAGAREARGEFVFLTESHCVPERECLSAMLDELDRTGAPGVRGADPPEVHGTIGRFERDAFLALIEQEEDPDHWRRILVHSLAMRRDLYLDAGGLPPRFGDFGAWVLAIALDRRAERLIFSPRPRVHHVYDGDFHHIRAHLLSFGRGEMLYRSESPPELSEKYLEPAIEWEQRLQYTRAGARRAVRAALALRHRGSWAEALGHAAVAIFGSRAPIMGVRARAALAALSVSLPRHVDRRRRDFFAFWRLTHRRGRLEVLAKASLDGTSSPPAARRLDPRGSFAGTAIGVFHLEERDGEAPIRWTAPLALLRVVVPGGERSRARLELDPLLRPNPAEEVKPRIAIDNRIAAATISEDAIEFEIEPGEHWIALACNPLRPRTYGVDDPRSLGLPMLGLSFGPMDGRAEVD